VDDSGISFRKPHDGHLPMVLHVRVVTGHGGGPEKTILNSPRFLNRLGYQSKLAYMHPPGDPGLKILQDRGRALNAEVLSVPDRGPFDMSVILKLRTLCRDNRVAIWHGHDYKSNLLGLLIRPFWRMKLVTTLHGWTNLSGRMPLYAALDKFVLKYYQALICVSDDLQAECLRWRVPAGRCHVIYNAIDTDDYRRKLEILAAKRKLAAPEGGLLIGTVGRLSPEKGYDLLIRAVHRLRTSGCGVTLWIAGDGDSRESLQRLIEELGCREYVRLVGHLADPKTFYEAMDIFVLSSIREGLPNVILEAMSMETPVVATRVAGVPMLVEDGQSGLIVDPGSEEALKVGLKKLIEDPALRESLRQAGRRRVESHFAFDRRMEKVAQVYDGLLKIR
jgi:glycosyltransferase involved in cell wall biosynthesis